MNENDKLILSLLEQMQGVFDAQDAYFSDARKTESRKVCCTTRQRKGSRRLMQSDIMEMTYKKAADVLQNYIDWRACGANVRLRSYADVDDALQVAVSLLRSASDGLNTIKSDADVKLEKIRQIINE